MRKAAEAVHYASPWLATHTSADSVWCYPLTVTDNYSRYLLGCQALSGTLLEPTKAVFTRLFKEYGLPRRIRTDNGAPFSAPAVGRLKPAVGVVDQTGGAA